MLHMSRHVIDSVVMSHKLLTMFLSVWHYYLTLTCSTL